MELVEGESLRQFCSKAQAPGQVAGWGTQIAAALAAAHAHSIVHRDVKPENIMVRPDGLIKVLDFGLARDLTGTYQSSTAGLPVGTLRYMSPEQTRGEKVTGTSDVFSLGIVLYELLTGQHPFRAESPFASAHAIAATSPTAPSALGFQLPPPLESLLLVMLEKDPAIRPTAASVSQKLSAVASEAGNHAVQSLSWRRAKRLRWPGRPQRRAWLAAAVGGLAVIVGAALLRRSNDREGMPEILPFTTLPGEQFSPAFSPDGRSVAFASGIDSGPNFSIYLKPVSGGAETRLTPAGEIDYSPAWSPDGKWIAYIHGPWWEKHVALDIRSPVTGETRKVANLAGGGWFSERNVAWADSKSIIVHADSGLVLVSLNGEVRQLTSHGSDVSDYGPAVSSDGRELVFTRNEQFAANLYLLRLDGSKPLRRLPLPQLKSPPVLDACWLPGRNELVVASGSIGQIWRVPTNGSQPRLLAREAYRALTPSAALDGRHIVYVHDRSDFSLWTLRLDAAPRKLERNTALSSTRDEFFPQYSPDGQRVAFESNRSGYEEIWTGATNGSDLQQLTHLEGPQTGSPHWSPDGKWIAFDSRIGSVGTIFIIDSQGGAPKAISPGKLNSYIPTWSRNGEWVYFTGMTTGRSEAWRVKPDGSRAEQLTHGGGYLPIESLDGHFVYHLKSRDQPSRGIWKLSLASGEEARVVPAVVDTTFAVERGGLYFLGLRDGHNFLERQAYDGSRPEPLSAIARAMLGFAIRNDGREVMLGLQDAHESDLVMMILRSK